jgi:hypothetical protein
MAADLGNHHRKTLEKLFEHPRDQGDGRWGEP